MNKEEFSSPTVALESVILTTVNESHVAIVVYITNTFIQTNNTKKVGDQLDIMKIRVKLAQILL